MAKIYVDYTGRLSADTLKSAGISGVCRYLSWQPNPKVILWDEYDGLVKGGVDVVLNWEYDTYDWLAGYGVGQIHGREAVRQAQILGYPKEKPIPGSCDFNISRNQWDNGGKGYAQGFAEPVADGGYVPGVYGPWNALQWCHDEIPLIKWYWQAGMSWAWDNNNQDWPNANLIQRRHMSVNGLDTDLNIIGKDWTMAFQNGTPPTDQEIADWWWYFYNGSAAFGNLDPVKSGWNFPRKFEAVYQAVTQNPSTTVVMSEVDKQEIIEGVAAKVTNDLAEAVFERIKAQMDK
jgi:hypothetical protein